MEDYTVDEWAGQAVMSLTKGSEVCVGIEDGKLIHWELIKGDIQKPTEQEITDEVTRLKELYASLDYARKRKEEYPSIEDVTVALAEKAEGDSTMWDEITVKRQAIKAKYPKE